jgi:hypothetical protein
MFSAKMKELIFKSFFYDKCSSRISVAFLLIYYIGMQRRRLITGSPYLSVTGPPVTVSPVWTGHRSELVTVSPFHRFEPVIDHWLHVQTDGTVTGETVTGGAVTGSHRWLVERWPVHTGETVTGGPVTGLDRWPSPLHPYYIYTDFYVKVEIYELS